MFAAGAVSKNDSSSTIAATKMTFGASDSFAGIGSYKLKFNFLLMLSFFLPLILTIVALVLSLVGKTKAVRYLNIAVFVAFLIAIIGFFTALNTSVWEITILGNTTSQSLAKNGGLKLGAGTITAGVFSIFGLLGSAAVVLVPLIKK